MDRSHWSMDYFLQDSAGKRSTGKKKIQAAFNSFREAKIDRGAEKNPGIDPIQKKKNKGDGVHRKRKKRPSLLTMGREKREA